MFWQVYLRNIFKEPVPAETKHVFVLAQGTEVPFFRKEKRIADDRKHYRKLSLKRHQRSLFKFLILYMMKLGLQKERGLLRVTYRGFNW